ncbi:cytochrome c3 family protein [Pragia fontium]|uniref:cytochrome c3 family protein n=1 Tax=Pragia fontium TaxID=82985 RepID=UPI00069A908A|nr:cytochrome c3 family protein [Pragia fontium]
MKKALLMCALFCLGLASFVLQAGEQSTPLPVNPPDTMTVKEYPLKPHHKSLQFACTACHQGQDQAKYKPLSTKECLACHGSAEKVARRTGFMDSGHTNPHRSLHDGLDLDCYECHAEHKPSNNLCQVCHDNTSDWFGPTP